MAQQHPRRDVDLNGAKPAICTEKAGRRRPVARFSVLLALLAGAVAAKDNASLIDSCARCHGNAGNSTTLGVPSIGGQNAPYLLQVLEEYRSRARPTEVPDHLAEALAEADLTAIANHFAAQPYIRQVQAVDAGKVARGAEAYERICQLCHPDSGRATTYSEYPLLAGQDLDYMRRTMAEIVSGKRPANGFMREMIGLAPAEKLDEAIHFFAAQEVWPEEVQSAKIGSPTSRRRRFNPGRQ